MKLRTYLALLSLVALLPACSSGGSAMLQTLRSVAPGDDAARAIPNPNFQYLRVTVDGRLALFVLGYIDPHPLGPVEVWYSAEKEVLRLQNGRLVGATGSPTEWQGVDIPLLPAWATLARTTEPLQWTRTRDVMPGYRFGLRDALSLRVTAAPDKSALLGITPQSLVWFEERMQPPPTATGVFSTLNPSDDNNLPVARYALALRDGKSTIVYGEQCLSARLCFSWQRWPVVQSSAGPQ
ncbi:MAG: YjbF family lipoprotein [Betaproteobacteria bacterium]